MRRTLTFARSIVCELRCASKAASGRQATREVCESGSESAPNCAAQLQGLRRAQQVLGIANVDQPG